MPANHPSTLWRSYRGLWANCFDDDDWYLRLLSRLTLISLHAGVGFALLMLVAWADHFWRLHV